MDCCQSFFELNNYRKTWRNFKLSLIKPTLRFALVPLLLKARPKLFVEIPWESRECGNTKRDRVTAMGILSTDKGMHGNVKSII